MKVKKILITILYILLLLVSSPLIIFGLIIFFVLFIIPAPIEYLIYKNSSYYKSLKKKYSIGICHEQEYYIYNLIKKYKLPIEYKTSNNNYSFLEFNNIIILFSWFEEISYDPTKNLWEIATTDNDELIDLQMQLNIIKNICFKGNENSLKILLHESIFDKIDLKIAKLNNDFLIYKNKNDLIDLAK